MISGEVQSLALPLTPREVKQNRKYEVGFHPAAGSAAIARSDEWRVQCHQISIAASKHHHPSQQVHDDKHG